MMLDVRFCLYVMFINIFLFILISLIYIPITYNISIHTEFNLFWLFLFVIISFLLLYTIKWISFHLFILNGVWKIYRHLWRKFFIVYQLINQLHVILLQMVWLQCAIWLEVTVEIKCSWFCTRKPSIFFSSYSLFHFFHLITYQLLMRKTSRDGLKWKINIPIYMRDKCIIFPARFTNWFKPHCTV